MTERPRDARTGSEGGARTLSGKRRLRAEEPSQAAGPSKPAPLAKTGGAAKTPGLVLVATPIGNAADITVRALAVLKEADTIACEDTRRSGRLLARYGISTPLVSYHEHNASRMRPRILARLRRGEAVALIADAGTPLVSDPGYKLVRACVEEGLPVTVAPGPSAAIAALLLSGLPTDRFYFHGFLPAREKARREALERLRGIDATLLFFESAQRIRDTLAAAAAALGGREAAVVREMTKRFEEVTRGPLGELADRYRRRGPPKGEIVLVVGPPARRGKTAGMGGPGEVDGLLREALSSLRVREAALRVAALTGRPRREVYARALALKGTPPHSAEGGG